MPGTKTKKRKVVRTTKKQGTLIIVGGHEDKVKERRILREVADRAKGHRLVVATIASELPDELWEEYHRIFRALGVKDVKHLHLENSECARDPVKCKIFDGAKTVFFTGGDQLRITSKIGGTPVADRVFKIYHDGGTIAGTSAGASVMGETMLVGDENQESHKVGNWMMAPGLGLVHNMIIDQHFAQRGRIGRLLGAVSLNPVVLGIGIDENTSIIIHGNAFKVIGHNAIYVIDGCEISYTNISEAAAEKTMSMHNVRLHILSEGDTFDLVKRHPSDQRKD